MAPAPLWQEIPFRDPAAAFAPFAGEATALLLDAPPGAAHAGRFAFIAASPAATLTTPAASPPAAAPTTLAWADSRGQETFADPFAAMESVLSGFTCATIPGLPRFQGGLAGYWGYELGRWLEALPAPASNDQHLPALALGVYDVVAAFDVIAGRAWVISTGFPETVEADRQARADRRLKHMAGWLESAPTAPPAAGTQEAAGEWTSDVTRPGYERAVQRVIDYIHAGDIFQANLSQRFIAALPENFDAYALYQRLRRDNPAPFAAYQRHGDVTVAAASPERFLWCRDGVVETRPIKGTRKRAASRDADEEIAEDLLDSAKDRAENVMIVDLLRNDLSRVCAPGTIAVPQLCALESYATVHHLVSAVTGRLEAGFGPVDLLRAAFPGGSITGAPKIRAQEIIAELEPTARGPYCGAQGYIGFDRTMDTSIGIRLMALAGGRAAVYAGGGIVADSVPESEYFETLAKARALLDSLPARNLGAARTGAAR